MVGMAGMIGAAACVGAALGIPHPLTAALVIVPAIELARKLPLTPGNVGLTSAAVAVALHGQGVPMSAAVATGIALHAVETVVGVTFGAVGALSLTPRLEAVPRLSPRLRRALAVTAPAVLLAAAAGGYVAFG
jgi:hypothetical protein